MLKAIFYARFHPERGPSIIHQFPRNSIIAPDTEQKNTLVDFSHISTWIIPPYDVCNRPLSVGENGYQILGFPISLEDPKYERNRFTFNICFVVKDDGSSKQWWQIVSKTAAFFKTIEEEDGLLQAEERLAELKCAGDQGYPAPNVGIVYELLEAILEDLNTYGETCVRIDDLHVLNLAKTQPKAAASKVKAWDVPLLIRSLPSTEEWTWDLSLQRIHSYIDGVNHVQRIAELADVELKLVKKAVRELLFHDRVMLLDIFHFQAIYTLTSDFAWFAKDESMQEECARYVAKDLPLVSRESKATSITTTLVELYRGLHSGLCVRDFYSNREDQLADVDIRRLITFGVIKGFLRRIHKYALAIESHQTPPRLSVSNGSMTSRLKPAEDAEKEWDRAWRKAAFSSGWADPPTEPPSDGVFKSTQSSKSVDIDLGQEEKLKSYLDGRHCMDEICVGMRTSEKKVIERLRSGRFGEVVFFCR